MEAVNFPYFGVCTRGFVLDCAISVTAVYLVSVTGKQSVKESKDDNSFQAPSKSLKTKKKM